MRKTCLVVLVGLAVVLTTAGAQNATMNTGATSAAGQSMWHHDRANSVTGQSIWHHVGAGGPVVRQGSAWSANVCGGIRRNSAFVFLVIRPTCDFGCYGCDAAVANDVYQEAQSYYQPGYQWGAGLKDNSVAWVDFLPYLEQYLLSASPVGRDAFRRGFIEGFGGNGEATYDYAFRQAARPG